MKSELGLAQLEHAAEAEAGSSELELQLALQMALAPAWCSLHRIKAEWCAWPLGGNVVVHTLLALK